MYMLLLFIDSMYPSTSITLFSYLENCTYLKNEAVLSAAATTNSYHIIIGFFFNSQLLK